MELVVRKLTVPDGKPVWLAPLGDIQWAGRTEHIAWRQLQDHVKRALDLGAWFVGLGDYIDFASPSNRQRLRSAALYDTAEQVIDDKAKALVDELYGTLLKPTTGRWLGLVEGHHWTHLLTGETTDQYLCRLLKAPFLGTSAFLGLSFQTAWGPRIVSVWLHHGHGGGSKAHAPLLKLENLAAYWEADLFLVGHMTKQAAAPISRVRATWQSRTEPGLKESRIYLVGTGGWLKGYAERSKIGRTPRGSYVESKMLNPVSLGAPLIRITPKVVQRELGRDRAKGRRGKSDSSWEPEIRVEV